MEDRRLVFPLKTMKLVAYYLSEAIKSSLLTPKTNQNLVNPFQIH
jgi:hypothetical protein